MLRARPFIRSFFNVVHISFTDAVNLNHPAVPWGPEENDDTISFIKIDINMTTPELSFDFLQLANALFTRVLSPFLSILSQLLILSREVTAALSCFSPYAFIFRLLTINSVLSISKIKSVNSSASTYRYRWNQCHLQNHDSIIAK